jgi:hypothetical protein
VTTKATAMLAALGVVAAAFQRKADVYGTLSSQDAEFKDLQQQVNAALALPDDPAPDAPPPPPPDLSVPVQALADSMSAMLDTVSAINIGLAAVPVALAPLTTVSEKLDGMEDTLGAIMASLPAPAAA